MMSRSFAVIAALVLLIGAGAVACPTVSNIYRLYVPTATDWDSKTGWRLCADAIASWPRQPAPVCRHLHMCANEATLDPAAFRKLGDMVRATPECPAL